MTPHIIIAIAMYALGLAFFGILGYKLAFFLTRSVAGNRRGAGVRHASAQALAILAERYARGEINQGEYAERKSVLGK